VSVGACLVSPPFCLNLGADPEEIGVHRALQSPSEDHSAVIEDGEVVRYYGRLSRTVSGTGLGSIINRRWTVLIYLTFEPGTQSDHLGHYPEQRGEPPTEIVRLLDES